MSSMKLFGISMFVNSSPHSFIKPFPILLCIRQGPKGQGLMTKA